MLLLLAIGFWFHLILGSALRNIWTNIGTQRSRWSDGFDLIYFNQRAQEGRAWVNRSVKVSQNHFKSICECRAEAGRTGVP